MHPEGEHTEVTQVMEQMAVPAVEQLEILWPLGEMREWGKMAVRMGRTEIPSYQIMAAKVKEKQLERGAVHLVLFIPAQEQAVDLATEPAEDVGQAEKAELVEAEMELPDTENGRLMMKVAALLPHMESLEQRTPEAVEVEEPIEDTQVRILPLMAAKVVQVLY